MQSGLRILHVLRGLAQGRSLLHTVHVPSLSGHPRNSDLNMVHQYPCAKVLPVDNGHDHINAHSQTLPQASGPLDCID